MDKTQLRRHYRESRQNIVTDYRLNAAETAAQLFLKHSIFQDNTRFAAYIAVMNELDVYPILKAIWANNKFSYLPVLLPSYELSFAAYKSGDELKPNRYHIPEPAASILIDKADLDVVLVPLVAFDRQGNRLGAGGGYYDRTFKNSPGNTKLIGVGFALQEAKQLPTDPWDVSLDGVLTEKELIMF